MINRFEELLTGGHPNSLGNTLEVVDEVLQDEQKLEDLYQCYFSEDEVVRLRVSNAMKRVCKQHPDWVGKYLSRFLEEIILIDQASTQWTMAQLFLDLEGYFTDKQMERAKDHLKANLANHHDWIVLNTTMQTLSSWGSQDKNLAVWLKPHLERLSQDPRKSVAKTATKLLSKQ